MDTFWTRVTDAQATIISALLTIIAAVVGVMLGGWIFGGRVQDLKGALDESKRLLSEHERSVREKLVDVQAQLSSSLEAIGQLRGSVGDLQSVAIDNDIAPEQVNVKEKIRGDWTAVRDSLERYATSNEIDGRTRAKYARIDRRSYVDLVDALHADWEDFDGQGYREAVTLWNKYKNGKLTPSPQDLADMEALRNRLV